MHGFEWRRQAPKRMTTAVRGNALYGDIQVQNVIKTGWGGGARGHRGAVPGACRASTAQLVEIGEAGGQLEPMLARLADIYDREVQTGIKRLLTVLEPLLILGLGGRRNHRVRLAGSDGIECAGDIGAAAVSASRKCAATTRNH